MHTDETVASSKEVSKGFSGDLFDKPFVPRMDDGSSADSSRALVEALGEEDPNLAAVCAAAANVSKCTQIPIGSAVEIEGLKSRGVSIYIDIYMQFRLIV